MNRCAPSTAKTSCLAVHSQTHPASSGRILGAHPPTTRVMPYRTSSRLSSASVNNAGRLPLHRTQALFLHVSPF
ncbi:unnamed protein product [Chondrus crispus]|uniref:Uncharacterized protein n=1 Tax=Chondrus crispus TaxID=2769 RepID=R7Q4T6_CHOCR|nr:unnamed protein product [Chondrus crispus]CDF33009.1 unnamed protein product [Chondrus crispus]|eukprot:XP_005712812.1 unnamed protein product [Chondrus crispus]